ncbi:hypothetical protein C8Q72DRAFT_30659 [Fomitopsis betulina]|nr:hypothetical protein C8Q72DRAFT_30659 [Fomitopsis betulina]
MGGQPYFTVSAFSYRGHGRLPHRWSDGVNHSTPHFVGFASRRSRVSAFSRWGHLSIVRGVWDWTPAVSLHWAVSRALLAYGVLSFFAPMVVKQAQALLCTPPLATSLRIAKYIIHANSSIAQIRDIQTRPDRNIQATRGLDDFSTLQHRPDNHNLFYTLGATVRKQA